MCPVGADGWRDRVPGWCAAAVVSGYSSLLTNPINKQPVFESAGPLYCSAAPVWAATSTAPAHSHASYHRLPLCLRCGRYFGELRSLLEGAGHTVVVPVLPRSYKVERRAKALQVALGLTDVQAELVAETGSAEGEGRQTQKQTPVTQSERRDVQEAAHDERALPAASSTDSEDEGVTVLTNHGIDLAQYKGPFHLIAHSMGGLDSRFLITHLQPDGDNRILSLTTIGSPHHGSPIADLIVEQVQKDRTVPIPAPTLAATASSASSDSQHSDSAVHGLALPTFKIEQIVAFISSTFHLDLRGEPAHTLLCSSTLRQSAQLTSTAYSRHWQLTRPPLCVCLYVCVCVCVCVLCQACWI